MSEPETRALPGPNPDRNLERALRLGAYTERALDGASPLVVEGVLRRTVGLAMEAEGCHAELGGRCDVVASDGRMGAPSQSTGNKHPLLVSLIQTERAASRNVAS